MTTNDEVLDSPTDWVAEHIRSYVETGAEDGYLFMGFPTLLLTTLGRRSGKLRRTPLFTARARTATPEERRRLWPLMAAVFPRYDTYQAETGRELPLVIVS